ncbi:MAG: TetR/AcrR family transcriptional regulator [Desertimonas sp.]
MTSIRQDGDAERPGLRVRKIEKAKKRATTVARRLIAERGYDATSLDDIAEEAEISVSTLLRYFGSKERLVLGAQVAALERFRVVVEQSGPTSTLERWRSFVASWAAARVPSTDWETDHHLIATVPAIHRLNSHIQRSYQDLLAAGFAREAGADPDHDLYGRLLAALLVAGNETVFHQWLAGGRSRDLVETCLDVIDFAEARLGDRESIPSTRFGQGLTVTTS